MKLFYTMYGIGCSKYSIFFHDGIKKHPDGSDFYDIELFKNKKKQKVFIADLKSQGYTER